MSITREQAATWFATTHPPGPAAREMYRMSAKALRPVSLEKADDDDPASQRLVNMAKNVVRSHTLERIEEAWRGEWEWYDEEIGSPLEGVEREWGWRCSKCKIVLPDDFDDPDNPPAMRFCQWCGAPMTDEAVEVTMKRLEVLNEKD